MVLAQFVKRKQLADGIKIGREQGREEGREEGAKDAAETMREWAQKRGIPADELPDFNAPRGGEDDAR